MILVTEKIAANNVFLGNKRMMMKHSFETCILKGRAQLLLFCSYHQF